MKHNRLQQAAVPFFLVGRANRDEVNLNSLHPSGLRCLVALWDLTSKQRGYAASAKRGQRNSTARARNESRYNAERNNYSMQQPAYAVIVILGVQSCREQVQAGTWKYQNLVWSQYPKARKHGKHICNPHAPRKVKSAPKPKNGAPSWSWKIQGIESSRQ